MIEKACGVPVLSTRAGSFITSDSTSMLSSSNPSLLRLRMRRTGRALAFICSPRPSLARTAAPPLIWMPPPIPGFSSSRRSNTVTSSTPVSRVFSAFASASPPIPAPTTATRFGGGVSIEGGAVRVRAAALACSRMHDAVGTETNMAASMVRMALCKDLRSRADQE